MRCPEGMPQNRITLALFHWFLFVLFLFFSIFSIFCCCFVCLFYSFNDLSKKNGVFIQHRSNIWDLYKNTSQILILLVPAGKRCLRRKKNVFFWKLNEILWNFMKFHEILINFMQFDDLRPYLASPGRSLQFVLRISSGRQI